MHDIKKQMQFIELRAQGNSYQSISKQIGVSKQTLLNWSKLASTETRVAELEALEFDAIKEAHGLMKRSWVEFIARTLEAAMNQMDERNQEKHAHESTNMLLSLIERLKARLDEETKPAESGLTEEPSEEQSSAPMPERPDDAELESAGNEGEQTGDLPENLDRFLTISGPVPDDSEESASSVPGVPSRSGRHGGFPGATTEAKNG